MKLSIRWALIAGILTIIWGTQLFTLTYSYFSSEKVLIKHAENIMLNITELTMKQSQNYLALAQTAANLSKKLIADDILNTALNHENYLEKYFFDQLSIYQHFAGIYFATPKGEFFYVNRNESKVPNGLRTKIIRYNNKGEKTTKIIWRKKNMELISSESVMNDLYNPCVRPWYKLALNAHHVAWTDPYIFFSSRKPGITISGASFTEDGKLIGVVGVDIDIQNLSHFISQLRIGTHGKAFIFNQNGDMVAFPDLKKIKQPDCSDGSCLLSKINFIDDGLTRKAFNSRAWDKDQEGNLILDKEEFTWFKYKGKKYHAMFSPFTGTNWPWIIGVYIPENDYLGSLKKNWLKSFGITIVLSIIMTLAGLLFSRSITKPIINLKKEAKAVGKFDILSDFDTNSIFTDIQYTSDAFKKMKKDLYLRENEKSMLEHELLRLERFSMIGQLANALVNELKSPMHSVKTLLIAMRKRSINKDLKLNDDMDLMENVLNHCEYSLKTFQDLNRPALMLKMNSNINVIIEKTINFIRRNLSKNLIEVTMQLDKNIPDIEISEQHFTQLFLNILNNAIESISKATQNEPSVTLDDRLMTKGSINIRTDYTNNNIEIHISDSGKGIPEDLLPNQIFDMLITERRSKAIGIGLAICKTIVVEYYGKITACNLEEKGAEISISIPVSLNS